MEKIDEILDEVALDKYCSDILVILWKAREMRFNEIYRTLKKNGIELSKPTLSEHLKHLRKKKWITRKAKGVQNVEYKLHESIDGKSDVEVMKWLEDSLKDNGVIFSNPSPEQEVDVALCDILSSKLEEVVLRIEIEPRIQNKTLNLVNSRSKAIENDLLRECNKNGQYRKLVLDKTKEILKNLQDKRLRTIAKDEA